MEETNPHLNVSHFIS